MKYLILRAIFAVSLFSSMQTTVLAQKTGQIETDRPDLTETSSVVGRGVLQIEASVQYERNNEGPDTETWATPTLFRYGLTELLELRLETDGYTYEKTDLIGFDRSTRGYSPIDLGVKYRFMDGGAELMHPSLSVLGHIGVPSGSSTFDQNEVTGQLKLLMDWNLAQNWGLGVNIGLIYDVDDDDDEYLAGMATAALGYDWTDQLGTYWEIAYQGPESSRDRHAVIFDTGVTYLLSDDLQLDTAIGTGIEGDEQADFFWTAGVSMRF